MLLPYGSGCVRFPEYGVDVFSSKTKNETKLSESDIVEEALKNPIASSPLHEMAKNKKNCVVIISDHTRPVPSKLILPPMLREIRRDNPTIDIVLLVATGAHRGTTKDELKSKLGEEIFTREKIEVHDCDKNNVKIGILPSGASLVINRMVAEADLVVSEGFIEPHFFAGFSGGRKSLLPGVCDRKTVLGNHCSKFIDDNNARTGILEYNPIHQDMVAGARMGRLSFILNVVLDSNKRIAAAFAGDVEQAHKAGCEYLRKLCTVEMKRTDIVITTNGGYPLDRDLYQCVKGMTAGESAVKPGGVIILVAECVDGYGGEQFYKDLRDCEHPALYYDMAMSRDQYNTKPDQWQSQILCRILMNHKIIIVTRPELESIVTDMKMDYARDLDIALSLAKTYTTENATIAVIPDGVSVIIKGI